MPEATNEDFEPLIDYEKWHKKCRDFMLYFDGYVRGATTPIKKLIVLFGDLEELVFGEEKTKSWAT